MESIKRYLTFVKAYRWMIVITIIVGIIKFGIPLLLPLLLKYVVDDLILAPSLSVEEKVKQLFWVMLFAFFIFIILRYPIEYYRQYFAQWTASKILYDIRQRLFVHLQKLSTRFYDNHKTGQIISRVINDVEQTKDFVVTGMMNIWLDMFTLVIALSLMFIFIDTSLTLVAIAVLPLYAVSVKYFYQRLRALTRKRSQALAEMQGHLTERVQGMAVIRSFALEAYEEKQFARQNNRFLDRALEHTAWNAKTFAVVNIITDLAPLLVLVYGGYQAIHQQLSPGDLAAAYAFLERIYGPLRRLVNSSTTLTQAIASMDRVFELMDEKYDIVSRPNAVKAHPFKGNVEFRNVSFKYEEEGELVLKNINLSVASGETVAIVGASGGGKSSLISLLPRFYDVTEGAIFIDGRDIRDYELHSLRDRIGLVLQESILFSDSVRENIMMGNPEASEEEMIQAAKAAHAHEFIMELPNGYDTPIGERGVKLSGGQKQRIALARVFLKNPPILILDEATSALDLESEKLIQESIERLAKNRTTFIVAHRLSTITHADRIVVLDQGQIVEMGTHEELMKKQGVYYELYSIQQLEA